MRKLILFAVLFGAGLYALLQLDKRSRPEVEPAQPSDVPAEAPEVPKVPEVSPDVSPQQPADPALDTAVAPVAGEVPVGAAAPAESPAATEPQETRIEISGKTTFRKLSDETGRKVYDLDIENLIPRGAETYDAEGIAIKSFDPVSGELRETIDAERGRVRIELGPEGGQPSVADEGRFELFDVTITQHVGGAMAPITFRAPALECFVERRSFRSTGEGRVEVSGKGFVANGSGLVVDGAAERFVLERGGEVEFETADKSVVRFATAGEGPLSIERLAPEGEDAIRAVAEKGGRLTARGQPEVLLDAGSFTLYGALEDGAMRIARAEADGGVLARRDADEFRGRRASTRIAADGSLQALSIEDEPVGSVVIKGPEGDPVEVDIEGVGPLALEFGTVTSFEMSGASRLGTSALDITVAADERIAGVVDEEGQSARFEARGSVRLDQGESRIETQALDLVIEGGEPVILDIQCSGLTKLFATDEDGVPLRVSAETRIVVTVRGEEWRVPLAEGVTMDVLSLPPRRLTAGTIRDFELATETFVAEDGVKYAGPFGEAEATRVTTGGDRSLTLTGAPGARARFRMTGAMGDAKEVGSLEALRIEVDERRLLAEGEARAALSGLGREVRLEAERVQITLGEAPAGGGPRAFRLLAERAVSLGMTETGSNTELVADSVELDGVLAEGRSSGEGLAEEAVFVARGRVEVTYSGTSGLELSGAGERFLLNGSGMGSLEPLSGTRISAWGQLPESGLIYELTADRLDFDSSPRFTATAPLIFVDATLLPLAPAPGPKAGFTEAECERLIAEKGGFELEGKVRVRGVGEGGRGLRLEAESVKLRGDFLRADDPDDPDDPGSAQDLGRTIESIEAAGGFHAWYEDNAEAWGEHLIATQENVKITGKPAQLEIAGLSLESNRIDADIVNFLVAADRGILRAADDLGAWSLAFAGLQPIPGPELSRIVLASPLYIAGDSGARGDAAVIWIDSEAWRNRGRTRLWSKDETAPDQTRPPMPSQDLVPNVFRRLHQGELSSLVRAAYFEGEVEVTEAGNRAARCERGYLDLEVNQGWLENAEITYRLDLGSRNAPMRTRASEIRTAADGNLHAKKATITACDHDEPHYVIESGDLTLEPARETGWRVSAKRNILRFRRGFQLPLPPISRAALDESGSFKGFENEEGEVIGVESIVFANTPRFGTSIGTVFQADIGRVGRGVGSFFGFDTTNLVGDWHFDLNYLGSRGMLYGLGLDLREDNPDKDYDDEFWLSLYGSGISDRNEDRGVLRVDEDDRGDFRGWYRARGRYPFKKGEWIDLAFTTQTDPGVQAEFFEGNFISYEERDSYLHWRKALGSNYLDATLSTRIDRYRTVVEELPKFGAYRGSAPITHIGEAPLLYSTNVDVAYLRRKEGDPNFNEAAFTDGLGDRDSIRIDNTHRLELPMSVGTAALRATPFLEGRLTGWEEGAIPDDLPTRAGLFGGVELATTFWKRARKGFLNELTPTVRFKGEILVEENGGTPVEFDLVENAIDGSEVEVGLRSRWWKPGEANKLDLELRGVHNYDRESQLEDTTGVLTLAEWRTDWGSMPVAIRHDGRYDVDDYETDYSRSVLALSPTDKFTFQVGFDRARDGVGASLYEAATAAARFRASPKWEIELRETLSLSSNDNLNNEVTLRRFSHDFLLEIRVGTRSGEGGTSFSINFNPLLIWRPSRLGILGRY